MDDVVYINPADTEYPIPFNPLQLDEGEDIDLRVDDNVTIFKRLMGDTGARMDEILRQTFYALLEHPGSTLLDIERLLVRSDASLRQEIIQTTSDPQTAYFFEKTYPSYPKDAHLPITTRIGRLVRPRLVRTLLCQPGKSFNFREAMDEGKILLFNLSDGILGEQTSQLLGQLIVSKIQMAVMSRVDTPAAARRPFYLYLDEFQTFTGVAETSYEKILSRARKYSLGLCLAHQQTGQISNSLMQEILGNVSTIIAFNVSSADATKLCKEFIMDMGVEAEHIPSDFLLRLKVGEAWGKSARPCFHSRPGLQINTPIRCGPNMSSSNPASITGFLPLTNQAPGFQGARRYQRKTVWQPNPSGLFRRMKSHSRTLQRFSDESKADRTGCCGDCRCLQIQILKRVAG
jgi:hypothetical protein